MPKYFTAPDHFFPLTSEFARIINSYTSWKKILTLLNKFNTILNIHLREKIPLFIFYSENIPLLNSAHFFYSSRKSKFIYHVFWTNHYSNLQWHQRELETWNSHQAGLVYLLTSKLFSQVILYLAIRMSNCFLFILLLFRCQ